MEGQGGQPLVAPNDVGGAHQMIVHRVGEVIGGDAVGFKKNVVDVILGDGELALHQVVKLELILNGAGGAEPKHPGLARVQLGTDVLQRTVTPDGVRSIVAGGLLIGFLPFPHGVQLVLGAEAGVGHALGNQLLGVDVVDGRPLTLTVGAVKTVVAVHGGTLVKVDAVVLQGVDEHLHRAGNLPLGIGVLHPEEQNAAALVGHPLGGQALHQIAQVDKAGGGGSHPGDDGTLRDAAGGIFFFQRLRGFRHVRKQKLGKCLIIHTNSTSFSYDFLHYSIWGRENQFRRMLFHLRNPTLCARMGTLF